MKNLIIRFLVLFCLVLLNSSTFANKISFETKELKDVFCENLKNTDNSYAYWKYYNHQNITNFYELLESNDLTVEALQYILFHEGIIDREFFDHNGHLKQGSITKIDFGNWNFSETKILFKIETPTQNYIVKVNKYYQKEEECLNVLSYIHSFHESGLKNLFLIGGQKTTSSPYIAQAHWNGFYVDTQQESHFFSIFYEAPGKQFTKLWDDYFDNKLTSEEFTTIFQKLGRSIGGFFKRTSINPEASAENLKSHVWHPDLNSDNVFFDSTYGITLIDYLGMFHEKPVGIDLIYALNGILDIENLYLSSVLVSDDDHPSLDKKYDVNFDIFFSFVFEFIHAFSAEFQEKEKDVQHIVLNQLITELKRLFEFQMAQKSITGLDLVSQEEFERRIQIIEALL